MTFAHVLATLAKCKFPIASFDLAELADGPSDQVRHILSKLYRQGKVERELRPGYKCQYLYRVKR